MSLGLPYRQSSMQLKSYLSWSSIQVALYAVNLSSSQPCIQIAIHAVSLPGSQFSMQLSFCTVSLLVGCLPGSQLSKQVVFQDSSRPCSQASMQLAFCEVNLSYLEVFLKKNIKKMYLIFVFINFMNRYNIGILHVSNASRKKLIQRLGCRISQVVKFLESSLTKILQVSHYIRDPK